MDILGQEKYPGTKKSFIILLLDVGKPFGRVLIRKIRDRSDWAAGEEIEDFRRGKGVQIKYLQCGS